MAREYSSSQKKIISNYYKNQDTIALQKLQELVSELYLCESEKKSGSLWKRVEAHLGNLKIKPATKRFILEERDLGALAKCISELI